MKKILSFGEIIWDVYDTGKVIGGAALNFAAHCSNCGLESHLYSAVGKDALGSEAKTILSALGVKTEFVFETERPTGQCLVSLDQKGVPCYRVLGDVAYDFIPFSQKEEDPIRSFGFDALYFGTLSQRNPVSRKSLREVCRSFDFSEVVCDVNLRTDCYDADSCLFCLQTATVLKVSEEEEPLLRTFGFYSVCREDPRAIVRAVATACPRLRYLLYTRGEKGALIYDAKKDLFREERAKQVPVVSTVGAGDSFFAAWVSSYLMGAETKISNGLAAEISAYVVSRKEAVPPYRVEKSRPIFL